MKKKKILIGIGAIVLLLLLVLVSGPRPSTDYHLDAVNISDNVEQWLVDQEAQFDNIKLNRGKKIYWANGVNQKTDTAIIYFHGFPSSRIEQSPVFENIAKSIGANIFFTRLTGHGMGADDMKGITLNDWYNDAWEAWHIGKKLGNEIIIAGHSNGAAISAWLCSMVQPKAWIMTSPHFQPIDPNAKLINLPWSNLIIKAVIGEYRDIKDLEKRKKIVKFTTFPHHSDSLRPLMAGIKMLGKIEFKKFDFPILFLYTENDKVVSVDAIKKTFQSFGSKHKKIISIEGASHNICGDIMGPEFNEQVENSVLNFIKEI